ncbi:MAG: DUF2852 domain-containing protein, partial [Pseudomonadota bacterium]
MTAILDRLDALNQPTVLGLAILSTILIWPIGIALFIYLFWSGRMNCRHHGGGRRMKSRMTQWSRDTGFSRGSGNAAFDEYRQETLDRLEDEQREFKDFLRKLKLAKDRAEFDQFMAERR